MSKYNALWAYIQNSQGPALSLGFDEIARIAGAPIDRFFLTDKKERSQFGWQVEKISMKSRTVWFHRLAKREI